ncbi:MAG: hypothetical protein N4A31_03080 [Rickettsiales bacterium]|jgi:hypothetical protein|nr:hypothetical protein [Rickettsiales bacterium]
MPIIATNIRQGELKKLNEIFRETQVADNSAEDSSINLGNAALHHRSLLGEALRMAAQQLNIALEGDDNIRIVNDARDFINDYYGRVVYPLEPIENVAPEANGWSILSMLGCICCFAHIFQQSVKAHMSGEFGFDGHDNDQDPVV